MNASFQGFTFAVQRLKTEYQRKGTVQKKYEEERIMYTIPQTIPEMLQRNVVDFPDREAVVAVSHFTGEWDRKTWRELDDITDRVAAGMAELKIKKGAKVAFMHGNNMEAYYVYLAIHKLGAMFVPINVRLVPREIEYIIQHSDAEFLFVGSTFIAQLEELRDKIKIKEYVCIDKGGESVPQWAVPFSKLLSTKGAPPKVSLKPEDEADLLYTSGTTGLPKGVVLTQANKVACGRLLGSVISAVRLHYAPQRVQNVFPFFTSTGVSSVTMSWLYYANTVILEPTFDVVQTLEVIQREKSTLYMGAPVMFIFILSHPQFKEFDTSSLRSVGYGASPMHEEVIRQIMDTWPGIKVLNVYGLTEGGTGGTYLGASDALRKFGSIGQPWAPDQEARIVDPNDNDVSVGEVGEIVLRGPNIMKEYYKDPEATKETLRNGWLHTGDLGYYDEDGYFYYTDRLKDMINRGGFNVYPIEVENVLYEHPAVQQCAVVGKPHSSLGEDVLALVVLAAGQSVTAEELMEFTKDKIAGFKRPREIRFVDALPLTMLGKVDKKAIRTTMLDEK